MIVLNETVIMDQDVYAEWLQWVKAELIPAVMETGYFNSYRILNVLYSPNEGVTCCIQYTTNDLESYEAYQRNHAVELKNFHLNKFENKLVVFESIMQIVS